MDLVDKYIVIHMPASQGITAITGRPADDSEGFVVVAGHVRGEAPVGLWVDVDEVVNPSGSRVSSEHAPDHPTFFVRWEFIRYARLYPGQKPDTIERRPGFL